MMPLKAIEVDQSFKARAKSETGPTVQYAIVNIVVRPTIKGIAQHMAKSANNAAMIITSKLYVKVVQIAMKAIPKGIIANKDIRKEMEKSSMRLVRTLKGSWMISLSRYSHYFIMMYDLMLLIQECTLQLSVRPQMENVVRIPSKLTLGLMATLCQFLCSQSYSAK